MNTFVIGLVGVKTSGKSTVSHMIHEFEPEATETALANKLKNTCCLVFGLERNQFDKQELKEIPFEIPKILTNEDIQCVLEEFHIYMTKVEIDSKYDFIGMSLNSPRHIAQIVGTEVLRVGGDQDIHCRQIKIKKHGVTIVSDCRFPNEFDYFYKMPDIKFIPIYIQRDEAEKVITENSHPSERCVFEFRDRCFKVDNNGTLSETERQVKAILDREIV